MNRLAAVRITLGVGLVCCLGAQTPPAPEPPGFLIAHLDEIKTAQPLQAGEASSALEILRGERVSAHLVQVRARIRPHFHRDHEELAYLIEGRGVLVSGERAYPVKAGCLMIIPRGVVHSYEAREPTVVLSVFNPPFDPADRVFLDETTTSP